MHRHSLWYDEVGAVFAEFAILLPLVVMIVCGSIDFLYAFYQWNAAAKAAEVGARIAAVSDPVAADLNDLTNQSVLGGLMPGSAIPSFTVTCRDNNCTCIGTCTGQVGNSFNSAAMNRIVFGRGSLACGDAKSYYATGMCDVLSSITADNVIVVYSQTGLGSAGRPGGPILFCQRFIRHTDRHACNDDDHHGRRPLFQWCCRILWLLSKPERLPCRFI
jgi:Flp pilus assembly protein TadG